MFKFVFISRTGKEKNDNGIVLSMHLSARYE